MPVKTISADLPDKLYEEIQTLVKDGWFASEGELLREAVRRYLEARRPELTERFLRSDVEWGLRGEK
jgi:Arc/MetJ-type ribon-helix-helix transcriptional regulator